MFKLVLLVTLIVACIPTDGEFSSCRAGVLEAPQGECGHVRRRTAANCAINGTKCGNCLFFITHMLTSDSSHDVIIISSACLHLVCHFDVLLSATL